MLNQYRVWKAEKSQREAINKEDIGKMLLTTESGATDGLTPRDTEETKET